MAVHNIWVEIRKNKLPGFVLTYKSEAQKLNWILETLSKTPGKAVIIDQKRTFIEEELKPAINKLYPDVDLNIVTAFSEEKYEPSAILTLGSPSMATGTSIEQPVSLFIVCLNSYISLPESYEQSLARLRVHGGLNADTKVFILAESRPLRQITKFKRTLDKVTRDQQSILDRINTILDSRTRKLDREASTTIEKTGCFMPVLRGVHHYDPTYFAVLCRDLAEHSFTQRVGAITFLRFFKENPDILTSVYITQISQLPDLTDEELSDISSLRNQNRQELIDKVKAVQRCENYEQAEEIRVALKEGQFEGEERELNTIAIAKFRAEFLGVENLRRTKTGLYSQATKRRPIAIVNTWLNLIARGFVDPDKVLAIYHDTLRVGKEPQVLLFDVSRKIWIPAHLFLEKRRDATYLADQIEIILRSLSRPEFKEAFQGRGNDYLIARRNQILKLLGVQAQKRKPSNNNPGRISFIELDSGLTLENGVDIETLLIWAKSADLGLGELVFENIIKKAKSLKEIDTAIKNGVFSLKKWYQDYLANLHK